MNPTLLVGPADWDAARMPQDEFAARLDALWRAAPSTAGAVVYGDRVNHAELAYLTNFTPKLEAALALLPRAGAPQLLVGGGANMLQAAKPLTFIADLRPLRKAGATVAQWARSLGDRAPTVIGGACMPHALHQEIAGAFAGAIVDSTAQLRALMRRKSARELAAIREACATLATAVTAMRDAHAAGAGATATVLAGEHAALHSGAQDVRTLFSLDRGRTLRPFEATVERRVDPFQVYVAVRRLGYWAEGFALLAASPPPGAQRADAILRRLAGEVRAGMRGGEIARAVTEAARPLRLHPVTAGAVGNAIGLALEEAPLIAEGCEDRLEAGGVYSVRVGLSDGRDHAIASAMLAVHARGNDVLWSSPAAAA